MLEHVRYEEKHYGLPVTMLPFVLAANRSILDRYGVEVPRTWEEMKEAGAVLKEHGIHAFTMPAGLNLDTAYRFLPLLYGAGGRVFNDDWTKAAFNGPAGRAALQFLVDLKPGTCRRRVRPTHSTRTLPTGQPGRRRSPSKGRGGRTP